MRVLFLDFDGPLHPTEAIQGLVPGVARLPVSDHLAIWADLA